MSADKTLGFVGKRVRNDRHNATAPTQCYTLNLMCMMSPSDTT